MSRSDKKTGFRLTFSAIAAIVLSVCLCVTTAAIVWAIVRVEENVFQTGVIRINLNDGKPVIEEDEYLFEPGMTVVKPFFIQNQSTWAVYYKIYLTDVQGDLQDVLIVTVEDGESLLFRGTAAQLTRGNTVAAPKELAVDERRDLTITFHFPKEQGNSAQDKTLTFTLCADAVQTKNNPDKLFD